MTNFVQMVTTAASQDGARRIAQVLVENRLAACVQIVGPIESVYRWEGKIETAAEWQCVIKTRASLFAAAQECITANHTYQVPEIIAVPIVAGSEAYLRWLEDETA